jgi:uncharacterized membrane protein YdjX (TVP38/TMEM64 family)
MMDRVNALIRGMGPLGMVVFGVIYVAATVLLVPGSAITLAAGLIFGLLWGTITVSLASTTGAACAFLIGRYVARDRVAKLARQHPRFGAVDRAVSQGGWKIVGLLRLSPAVPFNLQNYLYGLTGIRFWPCILTSWVAMLPGTFMYVYLGYLARAGVETASRGGAGVGVWALRIAGFVATVVVTIYVTRLARAALQRQTEIEEQPTAPEAVAGTKGAAEPPAARVTANLGWSAVVLPMAAAVCLAVAVYAIAKPEMIRQPVLRAFSVLGPPAVTMTEAYEPDPGPPAFAHDALAGVLERFVDDEGRVDYAGLKAHPEALETYLEQLTQADVEAFGRNERLALLLNAYNAFVLKLVIEHYPLDSIRDIPGGELWTHRRWNIGGKLWSLDDIEHREIRRNFIEPRIHFALSCAALGCPPLRREPYAAGRLDALLEDQADRVHSEARWYRFDPGGKRVRLTKLYHWYRGDFRQVAASVLEYAAQYDPELMSALNADDRPRIEWIDFKWALNAQRR